MRGDSAGEERVGMMVAHRLGASKWRDKKREMGGPLALDGHLLIEGHNNQPIVGVDGGNGLGEERRPGRSVWG